MFGIIKNSMNNEENKNTNIVNKNKNNKEVKLKDVISPLAFSPIIFGEEVSKPSLIDYPLLCSTQINLNEMEYINKKSEVLSNGQLYKLSSLNNNLVIYQLENYISQIIITNFCAAFSCNENKLLFSYIPLIQYVVDEVNKLFNNRYDFYDQILHQMINSNTYSSLDTYSQLSLKRNMIKMNEYIILLEQYACSALSVACDRAINDVIYQIHVIPNIKELYKKLADNNEFLSSIRGSADYQTKAAQFLKDICVEIIDNSMCGIAESITKIIFNLPQNPFFMFKDELRNNDICDKIKSGMNSEEAINIVLNNIYPKNIKTEMEEEEF